MEVIFPLNMPRKI